MITDGRKAAITVQEDRFDLLLVKMFRSEQALTL